MLLALVLVAAAAAPAGKKCVALPAPGTWLHLSAKEAPATSQENPDRLEVRRPYVRALGQAGLLVLNPFRGGSYELCTDRWRAVGPLLERRTDYGLPAPTVGDRELYFVGMTGTDAPFGIFARFDLTEGKWRPFPSAGAPRARVGHAQLWAGGRFVIAGGQAGFGGASPALDDAVAFDPVSRRWSALAKPPRSSWHTDAVVSLGDRLLLWPFPMIYEPKTARWSTPSTEGIAFPYQPQLRLTGDSLFVLGGTWQSVEGARYEVKEDRWRPLPPLALKAPVTAARQVVNGVPVLVGLPAYARSESAGDDATLYSGSSCTAETHTLHWLDPRRGTWASTVAPLTASRSCWVVLMTPDRVFLLDWPWGEKDGEARAFDPATGTWQRATVPARGGPRGWGEVRWDGRAFWQWGGEAPPAAPPDPHGPTGCEGTPPGQTCDPAMPPIARSWVDEGWRLEPAWQPLPP